MTNWNFFTKLPCVITMLVAGAILTAADGAVAKDNSDGSNVERTSSQEMHKDKQKKKDKDTGQSAGAGSNTVYGPPMGGAGGY
jgi:hypothetical protein